MTPRLVVRSAAEADILDAALWYEQRPPGLGTEFLRALDAVSYTHLTLPTIYSV